LLTFPFTGRSSGCMGPFLSRGWKPGGIASPFPVDGTNLIPSVVTQSTTGRLKSHGNAGLGLKSAFPVL